MTSVLAGLQDGADLGGLLAVVYSRRVVHVSPSLSRKHYLCVYSAS